VWWSGGGGVVVVEWWWVVQLTTLSLPTRVEVELGCDNNLEFCKVLKFLKIYPVNFSLKVSKNISII
jgi:hypothetical protein